jgi:hypothetical protein
MSRPRRRPSRLQAVFALAVSGSSLAALLFVGLSGFESEAATEVAADGQPQLELHASGATTSEPTRADDPSPAPAPKSAAAPTPVPASDETPDAPAPEPVAMVTVPDVSGERLWIARKHLADVGLTLAPRVDGRKIPTDEYPVYQVDSDATFGEQVPVGSVIEVAVEWWTPRFARGY